MSKNKGDSDIELEESSNSEVSEHNQGIELINFDF